MTKINKFSHFGLKAQILLSLSFLLGLILFAIIGMIFVTEKSNHYELISSEIENVLKLKSFETQSLIEKAVSSTKANASTLESLRNNKQTDRAYANNVVKGSLLSNPSLIGTSTAWEPNAWDGKDSEFVDSDKAHDNTGRFIPWWYKNGNKVDVEKLVDYEKPGAGDWYLEPKKSLHQVLSEPYLYPLDGKNILMVTISQPILENGKFIGLTTGDLPIDTLSQGLKLPMFENSNISIISSKGNVVAHVNGQMNGQNIKDLKNLEMYKQFLNSDKFKSFNFDGHTFFSMPIVFTESKEKWFVIAEVQTSDIYEGMYTNLIKRIIISFIGLSFVLLTVYFLLNKLVLNPLGGDPQDVIKFVKLIENGDLTQKNIHHITNPNSLMSSVINMQDNLTKMIQNIKETSEQIYTASNEISQGNLDLSNRTEHAASNLEETAASMEDITTSIKENASNTAKANEMAVQISLSAEIGSKKVNDVALTIQDIKDSGQKIATFLQTIDSISFQTNILALNAAIEAARAGESGRGFAVVANEVRNLSQKTSESAKEIKQLLENNSTKVEHGTQLAQDAQNSIEEMVKTIKIIAEMINNISLAFNQQSTNLAQVNETVSHLDKGIQQNAALVEETSAASQTLKTQIEYLNDLVSQFKT